MRDFVFCGVLFTSFLKRQKPIGLNERQKYLMFLIECHFFHSCIFGFIHMAQSAHNFLRVRQNHKYIKNEIWHNKGKNLIWRCEYSPHGFQKIEMLNVFTLIPVANCLLRHLMPFHFISKEGNIHFNMIYIAQIIYHKHFAVDHFPFKENSYGNIRQNIFKIFN